MNFNNLKSSKFVKFLKDCGLIKQLKTKPPETKQTKKRPKSAANYQSQPSTTDKKQNITPQKSTVNQITTVEADLIFKKLTGLEKPKSRLLLLSSNLSRQTQGDKENAKKKMPKKFMFPQFLKALVLVGAKINGLSERDVQDPSEILSFMVNNVVYDLDQQLLQSDRAANINASGQI